MDVWSCYDRSGEWYKSGIGFDDSGDLVEKERKRYTEQAGVAHWDMQIHKFKTFLELGVTQMIMLFSASKLGYLN